MSYLVSKVKYTDNIVKSRDSFDISSLNDNKDLVKLPVTNTKSVFNKLVFMYMDTPEYKNLSLVYRHNDIVKTISNKNNILIGSDTLMFKELYLSLCSTKSKAWL